MIRSKILATGSYLPKKILTNADLEKIVETSDEWITKRSGIKQRHIAADDEYTSDLAIKASRQAMEQGNVSPEDIDGVIVATTTPDQTFPSVAVKVQAELSLPMGIMAFDVQAVCSGFLYALATADNFIKAGTHKRILVIGAEKMSAILDWEDRTTCVLFGDGAGAVILESVLGEGSIEDQGIISSHLYANGSQSDLLYTNGGPSTTGDAGHIVMHGKEVFKYAVDYMAGAVNDCLVANNITAEDVDYLVPHQANIRILQATAKKLGVPEEKVIITLPEQGNTSAASVPLALDYGVRSGKIKRGDLLLFEAMGGGFTWGASLARY